MSNESPVPADASSKRVAAGICGILLGSLGIHKFILGYYFAGALMLLITLCSCCFFSGVSHLVGLIEGILYLVKSDEEFYNTYIKNRRPWF